MFECIAESSELRYFAWAQKEKQSKQSTFQKQNKTNPKWDFFESKDKEKCIVLAVSSSGCVFSDSPWTCSFREERTATAHKCTPCCPCSGHAQSSGSYPSY